MAAAARPAYIPESSVVIEAGQSTPAWRTTALTLFVPEVGVNAHATMSAPSCAMSTLGSDARPVVSLETVRAPDVRPVVVVPVRARMCHVLEALSYSLQAATT